MLSEVQVFEMAKLVFFNLDGGGPDEWEKLSSDRQEECCKRIRAIEENLSRLGLAVLPAGYVKPDVRKPIDRLVVEYFIKEFITSKVKKPSGIVNIFPYQALAYDLCKEFKFDERPLNQKEEI